MYIDRSKTYVGVVEYNQDPLQLCRVKVRVLDVFEGIPTEDIPWASPFKDLNGNSSNVPEVGKVLTVVFDSGNVYKPEYIFADHFNINLENKLKSLSLPDYLSMKSIMFDHKTQIYSNDSEGLKVDYKFNNMNILENSINLNLKDNLSLLNLGDATAGQQSILGNHWMDWFDQFVDNLLGNQGGPYLGNMGAPVTINPAFAAVLQLYKAKRDQEFLSHHVKIVDNNMVHTVKINNPERQNNSQLGDAWSSTTGENTLISDDYAGLGGPGPQDGTVQLNQSSDPSYVAPPTDGSPDPNITSTQSNTPLSDPSSDPKIDKLIRFLKSKGYVVYSNICELNIVGMRNPIKDDGTVTNKFDDKMYVFFKNENNNWQLVIYDITVVPGYDLHTTQIGAKRAILKLGQYVDQYKMGLHKNRPDHPCLTYATSEVHRPPTVKGSYDYSAPSQRGAFGINIHRSGNPTGFGAVYNFSEGCQVFNLYAAWQQFINLCNKQVSVSKKKTFTYTLCKQSEFNSFK